MTETGDGPAPSAGPSAAEARAALAGAAGARRALSAVTAPRWAVVVVLTGVALLPLAQLLSMAGTAAASAVLVVAIVAATAAYAARTGVTYRPQRSWLRPYLLYSGGLVVIFLGGVLLEDSTGLWWIWIIAAPLNVLGLVLLVRAIRRLTARQGP